MEETKQAALQFVLNGGKTYYQYGFTFKGANSSQISKEKALEYLSKEGWSFGKGFYELRWVTKNDEPALLFNEYSVNDMW